MDLRMEFVLRAKARGCNVSELCREYQVSRKTGYKWLSRYDRSGVAGLEEMARRPRRVVQTTGEVVLRIQELRRAHPRWGPKKLRVLLMRELAASSAPSAKTIARILERLGESKLRKPRRRPASVSLQSPQGEAASDPNDLWTADFKGWWKTKRGERCEPLTVRDAFSRFVLLAKAMRGISASAVRKAFVRLFEQFGLPKRIHVDNGQPFGSVRARGRLTEISAWWVSLGIKVEFSRPAHPQDNGAHERMHGDMLELEDHPKDTVGAEQRAFDIWVHDFNHVRPHEALGMKTPATLYHRSPRPYRGPRIARYPARFEQRRVAANGSIRLATSRLFVGLGFRGHTVAIERVDEQTVRFWFYEVDLGEEKLDPSPRRCSDTTIEASSSARCSAKRLAEETQSLRPSSTKRTRRDSIVSPVAQVEPLSQKARPNQRSKKEIHKNTAAKR